MAVSNSEWMKFKNKKELQGKQNNSTPWHANIDNTRQETKENYGTKV